MASPYLDRAKDTRKRLDSCWDLDLAWDKYPAVLKEVSNIASYVVTQLHMDIFELNQC